MEPTMEPGDSYRYLLLEDLTDPVTGEQPGADIDYVRLTKNNGDVHYVTEVLDFNVGALDTNTAADVTQLVGQPDSLCDINSGAFVSLGGLAEDGFVIVSFGDELNVIAIENGDSIVVGELGPTLCGDLEDDAVRVSVSVSNARDSFITIDTVSGANELIVMGL